MNTFVTPGAVLQELSLGDSTGRPKKRDPFGKFVDCFVDFFDFVLNCLNCGLSEKMHALFDQATTVVFWVGIILFFDNFF